MKKKVVGLALASIMTVGGVVGAATAYQSFTATERPDIKVVMDGKVQDYKDANGNTVYPVIINGTTYLPLRPIANSFGKDVNWNNDTQTITLGEPQPVSLVDVAELIGYNKNYAPDASKVKGEQNLTFPNIGDVGVKYQSGIKVDILGTSVQGSILNLDSSYAKLSCSLLSTGTDTINMKIVDLDTGIAVVDKEVKPNEIIELKDLDISGAKRLDFKVQGETNGIDGFAYFLNPIVE